MQIVDALLDAVLRKSMVAGYDRTRRTKSGKMVFEHVPAYEDARTRQQEVARPRPKPQGPLDQSKRIDSSVTDLTLKRHMKEIRYLEAAIKSGAIAGPARKAAKKKLSQIRAIVANVRPEKPRKVSTAKVEVTTHDKTAKAPLKHKTPAAIQTKAPAIKPRSTAKAPAATAALATPSKRTIRTADPAPLKAGQPRKTMKTGTPDLPSVARAARKAKHQAAVKPVSGPVKQKQTTLPFRRMPDGTSDAARAAAGKKHIPLPSEAAAQQARERQAPKRPEHSLTARPVSTKKQDARVELPGQTAGHYRNWFPDSEINLARLEPVRQAMVRAGEPVEEKARQTFVQGRKALETQYIKTWTPMIRHYAKRALQTLGMEAKLDDDRRPTGLYADFIQESYLHALQALRSHDTAKNKTGLRDLVAGNIQTALYQKWRKIIGATGMGSVRSNASLTKMSKVAQALEQKLGRAPTDEELAEGMGKTGQEVRRLKQLVVTLANDYLDRKANPDTDEGEAFGNILHSNRPGPDSLLEEFDMHDRLEGLMRDALGKVSSPEARLALSHELGFADVVPKAAKAVIKKHALDALAKDSLRLQGNAAKLLASSGKRIKGDLTLTPEQIVSGLGRHPAFAGKTVKTRAALVESLMAHGHDPMAMLTQDLETAQEEGGRSAKAGMVRNRIAQRLGYDQSYGTVWAKQAMAEMAAHAGLRKFRDEDLSKSWSNEYDLDPTIALYRELCGWPAAQPVPIFQRVTLYTAPESFQKALADYENVWTVTHEDGFSYQIVVNDLIDQGGDLIKSWGTDLEKQNPGGKWVTLHGVHVFINAQGHIIAGPHAFVGKHIDEMKDHMEAEHGQRDKKGKVTVDTARTGHYNAEHSHIEDAMKYSGKEHVIHANGKTLKIRVQGEYTGMEKKATGKGKGGKTEDANTTLKILHAHDPETGKTFPNARAALQHIGVDTSGGGVISRSGNEYLDKILRGIEQNPDIAQEVGDQLQRAIQDKIAAAGGRVEDAKSESKRNKQEQAIAQTREAQAEFSPNAEHSSDTHDVYSATAADGSVHHIQVNKTTGKVEGSPMMEQLIGHKEIRTQQALRDALAETDGEEQTIRLQNGKNTYLVRVRHDGSGNPKVVSGPLAGKRLHEIVGKNGQLQHFRGPVEHNGKQLYAGWDSHQGKLTALGNWSEEKAFDHFGAETDEEKQQVRDKLAAADKQALPPSASARLMQNGKVQVTMQHGKQDLEVARAINSLNKGGKAGLSGEDVDAVAGVVARDVAGKVKKRFRDAATVALGEGASEEQIEAKVRELAKEEYGLRRDINRHRDIARTLSALQEAGFDAPRAIGDDRNEHGFQAHVSQLEHLAQHMGALKLDRNAMVALDAHRQTLQDGAERAKAIADQDGLTYLPHLRSDSHDGHLPTTVRENRIDPTTGAVRGQQYWTKPQEQFIQRFADGGGKLINALGVGNGKTSSSLAAMEAYKKAWGANAPKKTLIVVPGNNQMHAWNNEFGTMMQHGTDGRQVHLTKGKMPHPDATHHVITAAQISNPKSFVTTADGRRIHIMQHLREQGFDSAILDEAHKFTGGANPEKSSTRKALEAFIHGKEHTFKGKNGEEGASLGSSDAMKAIIACTGTPMQNHLADIHHLVDLVHPGSLGSKKSFLARYSNSNNPAGVSTLAEGKEDELGSLLGNYMHRSTPEDLRTEQRPPTPTVHQIHIQADHSHVTPWRIRRDEQGNAVMGEDGKPQIEHGEAISAADMMERHEHEIRSSGADKLIEGEEGAAGKGALAAAQSAQRDLYAIKEPHVEQLVRQILHENPHAKIGAFSDSHEGQHMLQRVMARVLGDHNDQSDEARGAHYQKALENQASQHAEQVAKHQKIVGRAEHQLNRLKTFKEVSGAGLAGKSPKAGARLDDLIRNVEIRHQQLHDMGGGEGNMAEALRTAMKATKNAMGSRLGYRFESITHETDRDKQEQILKDLSTDGALKGLVLSARMASTGINAGHLTHAIDLDGNWNPAEREQMYARAARLGGSVPEAETYQIHVKPLPGQRTTVTDAKGKSKTVSVRSLDERKDQAATAKATTAGKVTQAMRRNAPSGAAKVARLGKEFGDGRFAKPAPQQEPVS